MKEEERTASKPGDDNTQDPKNVRVVITTEFVGFILLTQPYTNDEKRNRTYWIQLIEEQ